jgi:hypothetical protein
MFVTDSFAGQEIFSNGLLLKTHITILRHFDGPTAHARENLLSRGAAVAGGTFKINRRKIGDISC